MSTNLQEQDIDQLNSFLRGEISAVETYGQALDAADDPDSVKVLKEMKQSHEARVAKLQDAVLNLGGEPAKESKAWGQFAKAVEGGAKLFGESAAIAVLEEGEDHGLSDYREDVSKLSPGVQGFVAAHLLPEQKRSHDALSRLKQRRD